MSATLDEPRWIPAYIGIGSNLENPSRQVRDGIDVLASLPRSRRVAASKLYRTPPLGPQDQPPFVNAAAVLLTQLSALDLLAALKALEQRLGRTLPIVRWGPRLIDFDLLVFGTERSATEVLRLPHPGVAERAFVLRPLLDIAPDLYVPGLGTVRELYERLGPDVAIEAIDLAAEPSMPHPQPRDRAS